MTTPDWRNLLRLDFDYDVYANRLWRSALELNGTEDDRRVFLHILSASEIWISRIEGQTLNSMPVVPATEEALVTLYERWLKAIDRFEFNQVIDYARLNGQPMSNTFGHIARHVVNHGTYHRGQMRQLFGSLQLEYPETDFILFAQTFSEEG